METLYPISHVLNTGLFKQDKQSTYWSKEENKKFESALAIYDKDTPDRWLKVAAMIPGKTVFDVIKQYQELEEDVNDIEQGRVPIPGYLSSSFSFDLVGNRYSDASRKKSLGIKGSENERRKGIPWTEDEHRRFLMGLVKYGKGDWRNISRNFVITKTPTQVASHAQKYFIRQNSGGNDKKRPSIHDITTINLAETAQPNDTKSSIMEQHGMNPLPETSSCKQSKHPNVNPQGNAVFTVFNSASATGNGNVSMSSLNEVCPSNTGLQGYNIYADHVSNGAYTKISCSTIPSIYTTLGSMRSSCS